MRQIIASANRLPTAVLLRRNRGAFFPLLVSLCREQMRLPIGARPVGIDSRYYGVDYDAVYRLVTSRSRDRMYRFGSSGGRSVRFGGAAPGTTLREASRFASRGDMRKQPTRDIIEGGMAFSLPTAIKIVLVAFVPGVGTSSSTWADRGCARALHRFQPN